MKLLVSLGLKKTKQQTIKERIIARARDINTQGHDVNSGYGIIDSAFLVDAKLTIRKEKDENAIALYMILGLILMYTIFELLK